MPVGNEPPRSGPQSCNASSGVLRTASCAQTVQCQPNSDFSFSDLLASQSAITRLLTKPLYAIIKRMGYARSDDRGALFPLCAAARENDKFRLTSVRGRCPLSAPKLVFLSVLTCRRRATPQDLRAAFESSLSAIQNLHERGAVLCSAGSASVLLAYGTPRLIFRELF